MLRRVSIKWKITLLSFGIVLFCAMIGEILFMGTLRRISDDELGQQLLTTARTVAQMPAIIEELENPQTNGQFERAVEDIQVVDGVDYIVVMDMHRRILTDPLQQTIGTISRTSDEGPAFAEHTYLSKAQGDLGVAMRAFVPIMSNSNSTQVGVVLVGKVLPSLWEIVLTNRTQILVTLLLSSFFGVLGSFFLARQMKKEMFDMEPFEIARLLLERTATVNAMHEGIIAVDTRGRITIINDKSREILEIADRDDLIGTQIGETGIDDRIIDILTFPEDVFNQELHVGTVTILYSRVAVRLDGRVVGSIMIFQDRTDVAKLAEELTGVQAFVDALRVQNHEFLNKLHTIGGLVELDDREKVLEYIWEISEQREELTRFLSSRIHDPHITGLLLAKVNRGYELGVDVMIDQNTKLSQLPGVLDRHDLVTLIGNLIENGFDALKDIERKQLFFKLVQDDEAFTLMVQDNGCGMSENVKEQIFVRGFTTKPGAAHGYGMSLVQSIVDKSMGHIHLESVSGRGTRITITIPMAMSSSSQVSGI
ncbi:ATP-binding protein [Alicyclobacillus ferrooxydans]|uniref:histidine kinase n=1 Tax=Alicyclobacillus ferrooxydans TaxID=471514 RepID=A0A0P9CH78_9BACL|nr:sensor histidine kinase [Alicyclobacillus ferrooxydans]KPV45112.1 histidine kinase [Alicyclobacillus ferrooxydans]